jgi:hypothetical protein
MTRGHGDAETGRNSMNLFFGFFSASPRLPFAVSLVLLLAACVPVPTEMMPKAPGEAQTSDTTYPDIEPNGISISSLHFTLRGYNDSELRTISTLAEDIYNKIGIDTGLYSYLAGQSYTLVVYKDRTEFAEKTKQMEGPRVLTAGTALYTYPGPDLDPMLTHQMMHMIFKAYMGERAAPNAWVGEGLALHEEAARMSDMARTSFQTTQANKLRTDRMTFAQMMLFTGTDEEKRKEDAWYLQSESVISFLMRHGSSLTFAAFLNDLRNGADFDRAVSSSYSAKFRGAADVETMWKNNQ